MRKLLKSESGELMMFSDRETVECLFCPVTASADDRCLDSCAWYREEHFGSSSEVTCYCKEHEIGVRIVGEGKGEVIEKVIELAEAWVRRLSDYYDENHECCLDEGDVSIGEFIRGKLKP